VAYRLVVGAFHPVEEAFHLGLGDPSDRDAFIVD